MNAQNQIPCKLKLYIIKIGTLLDVLNIPLDTEHPKIIRNYRYDDIITKVNQCVVGSQYRVS